jgi:hypothetical protein
VKYCMNCGAELGAGRFCTNCGTPVGSATPPVDLPLETPVEVPADVPVEAHADVEAPADVDAAAASPASEKRDPHWAGWALLVIGIVLAVLLGSCLGRGGDPDEASAAKPTATTSASSSSTSPTPAESGRAGVDLALGASVDAPKPIRPGTDLSGNQVPYPATNMLDGKRSSAYRLAGNATGTVVRFSFPDEHTVSAVGLVNGYAKVDDGTDWYPLNRRIQEVEWTFSDGTTVQQHLVDTPDLQAMQIAPETTSWVELRIVTVSKPGGGRRGKDTTAISDVLLLGSSRRQAVRASGGSPPACRRRGTPSPATGRGSGGGRRPTRSAG